MSSTEVSDSEKSTEPGFALPLRHSPNPLPAHRLVWDKILNVRLLICFSWDSHLDVQNAILVTLKLTFNTGWDLQQQMCLPHAS